MNITKDMFQLFEQKKSLENQLDETHQSIAEKKKVRTALEHKIAESISPYVSSLPSTIDVITNAINSKIFDTLLEMNIEIDTFSLVYTNGTTEDFLQDQINLFEDILRNSLYHISMGWKCPLSMINRYLSAKIEFFRCCLKVVQEENEARRIDADLHRVIKEMIANSLIVGENSLITLRFEADNTIEQYLFGDVFLANKHSTALYVQTHRSTEIVGKKYALLNLQSPLGKSIYHLPVGSRVKYIGPEDDETTVIIEMIQYDSLPKI